MMQFIVSAEFKKKVKKTSKKMKLKIDERLVIFRQDPFNQILSNHPLHGEYEGHRSIDITGDVRLIYRLVDTKVALLVRFGTHPELYGR